MAEWKRIGKAQIKRRKSHTSACALYKKRKSIQYTRKILHDGEHKYRHLAVMHQAMKYFHLKILNVRYYFVYIKLRCELS